MRSTSGTETAHLRQQGPPLHHVRLMPPKLKCSYTEGQLSHINARDGRRKDTHSFPVFYGANTKKLADNRRSRFLSQH